jgi:hypothetical protein
VDPALPVASDAGGEQRRFDLVGSIVNISNYVIE